MAKTEARLYLWQFGAGALLLRLGVVLLVLKAHGAAWFFAQASELAALAANVNAGYGLSSPFGGSTGPSAFLAPGYPLLIAGVFHLFGACSRSSEVAIMLLQSGFSAATVVLLMLLAQRLFGARTANLAGSVWAVGLPLFWLPAIFWETSLSILLCTALIALAACLAESSSVRAWLGMGILSAGAILVNPSLLSIALCAACWAAYTARRAPASRPLAALLLCCALCAPWELRNHALLHAWVPLRSNSGYELWQGNHPGGHGFFDPSFHPNVNQVEFQQFARLGELEYMREKGQSANAYIFQHPGTFLKLTAKRILSFWTGARRDTSPLMTCYISLTSALGLAGLIELLKSRRTAGVLFLLPLLLFPLPYYVTHPDYRFRLILDPLLVVLAAKLRVMTSVAKVVGEMGGKDMHKTYHAVFKLRASKHL